MMALTYEEMRKQHFEELLKKAQRKLKYWEARLRKTRPNDMLHENVFKATDAGMECSFYKDALEALTANKWISVEERLPEEGVFVLLQYAKNAQNPTLHARNTMAVGRYEYGMFLVEGCSVRVTHWMPLPEPPEEE